MTDFHGLICAIRIFCPFYVPFLLTAVILTMKQRLTFVLVLCTIIAHGKPPSFSLTDTIFIHGAIHTYQVNFDIDAHDIREECKPHLDSLADFMKKNPGLILEIGSHTDQRGGDSSNRALSQARAGFIESYLVQRGISPYVLAAVGYGEDKPVVSQATINAEKDRAKQEDLYQKNRRTEFKILRIPIREFSLQDSVVFEGEIIRPNILYDLNHCGPRPESFPWLDSLVTFLNTHPNVVIEIGNHTDTRGSDASNMKLTDCRSRSVALYLFSKGIAESRVIYKGYGETQPIISEAEINKVKSKQGKEELHQVNRRTEIKIVKVN